MKFQFLTENFSRSENAPPFETRKIRQFEVERIFLENKKMVEHSKAGSVAMVDGSAALLKPQQFIPEMVKGRDSYLWY